MTAAREIRTKETIISVKSVDHNANLKHYMKRSSVRYRNYIEGDEQEEESNSSVFFATETMQRIWRKTATVSLWHVRKDLNTAEIRLLKEDAGQKRHGLFSTKYTTKEHQRRMLKKGVTSYTEKLPERKHNYSLPQNTISSLLHKSSEIIRSGNRFLSGFLYSAGGAALVLLMVLFFAVYSSFTNTTAVVEGFNVPEKSSQPDFTNEEAWGFNNPYTRAGYIGQCTWFAWGRFYEIYGYDPGFRGNGWNCAAQLVAAHPDKFRLTTVPSTGAVFSAVGRNHAGIVISMDKNEITIQEGNLDGRSNLFIEAIADWHEATYPIWRFIELNGGVVYAGIK